MSTLFESIYSKDHKVIHINILLALKQPFNDITQ